MGIVLQMRKLRLKVLNTFICNNIIAKEEGEASIGSFGTDMHRLLYMDT